MGPLLAIASVLHPLVPPARVPVGPGEWEPAMPASAEEAVVPVGAFLLATEPVSIQAYQTFLLHHPRWRRDRADPTFVDEAYLGDWTDPDDPGPDLSPRAPVTGVSWYAARAFCAAVGGRLPTEAEWELAASASATEADARQDPAFSAQLLAWYGQPTPQRLPPIGQSPPNLWGLVDLHGLVWEWVEDFNASLVSVDARGSQDGDSLKFCGGAAAGAADPADYASFMRTALRSSLDARDTVRNLGFRCAWDLP